jgi:predicted anti-sigma-YlaC factor YlaD
MSAEHTHSPTPEEIMEYVDGEGAAASRAAIGMHLATCAACQAIAAEQRGISEHAQAWTVGTAPSTLLPPAPPRARVLLPLVGAWRPSRSAKVGLAIAAALILVVASVSLSKLKPARSEAVSLDAQPSYDTSKQREQAAGGLGPGVGGVVGGTLRRDTSSALLKPDVGGAALTQGADALHAPMVIRTATVRIVAKDFSGVRAAVEGAVSQAGGFIDQMTVTGDNATARELRGTLRVPGDRMAATLARLRALGQVVEDTQGSQDVADQIVDLEARLASARATEKRLTELLANRTGKLSDVLEVEREITRVRLDIERLDAEKANMGRRVSYATIDVSVAEERKEGLVGPLSLATRLRVAAADGLESALDTVTATILFVLRAGPSLILWGSAAAFVWFVVRRRMIRPSA